MAAEDWVPDIFDGYDVQEEFDECEFIEIMGESDKAVLVLSEDGTAWFPKSVIWEIDSLTMSIYFDAWFYPDWEE